MKIAKLVQTLLLLTSLMLMAACKSDQEKSYKLIVEGKGLAEIELQLLILSDHTNRRPDPVEPDSKKDTRAVFSGQLNVPTFALLKIGDNRTGRFVLSNTVVKLEVDVANAKLLTVDGGVQQETKEEYDRIMRTDQRETLSEELKKYQRGSDEYNAILEKINALSKDDTDLQVKFIEDHPESIMSPYALWRIYAKIEEGEAIRLFHHIDTSLQQQAHYVYISKKILAWERNPIGAEVPNLYQNSANGKTVGLHDFKGQWLLIDFWASWCSPCRAANPKMLELYNKYHEKGIEFLGVSLDKNRDDWLKAIEDDGLIWTNVSDLNFWDNEISRYFGIRGIPTTLLIDPEGRIIAKKLHGDELVDFLDDIFNN